MIDYRIVAVALLATSLSLACDKREKSSDNQGLPPANQWEAPAPPQPGNAMAGDPHAQTTLPGMPANPHGGGMPANPHGGGMPANPHAGGAPANPHAGGAPANPHAGGAGQGSGVDVSAMGLQGPDPNRTINPDNYLRGSIKPTEQTKDGIPKGAVVFISVKRADPQSGQAMGSPLAVKRLRLAEWPLWFSLTDEDAMIMGTSLSGDVVITAWADQDQDAISKSPGDVLGTVRATVPSTDLTLTLDTVVQ